MKKASDKDSQCLTFYIKWNHKKNIQGSTIFNLESSVINGWEWKVNKRRTLKQMGLQVNINGNIAYQKLWCIFVFLKDVQNKFILYKTIVSKQLHVAPKETRN